MRDPWIWSVGLGRWWNVQVRLHLFFILFAVFAFYLSSHPYLGQPSSLGVGCVVVLLVSVLLHEIGHIVVARRLGGIGDEIVIGPLGGLSSVRVPYEPQSELVALMAGPLVNIGLCMFAAVGLVITSNIELVGLLNPLSPNLIADGTTSTLTVVLKLVFWINWLLILFNLIPVFPFDAGRALRAVLTYLWPELDAHQSLLTVARLSKVAAAALLVAAWLVMNNQSDAVPLWFVLTLLAIFVFFNARREEILLAEVASGDEHVFGYDFSQGYTSFERSLDSEEKGSTPAEPRINAFQRWLEKRRVAHERRRQEQESEDEKRVDEILSRLHQHGMHNLSRDDRELLQRVSHRYRSRQN